MPAEENKAVVRDFIEGLTASGWRFAEEHLAPDYIEHGLPPGYGNEIEGWRRLCEDWFRAIPDYCIAIDDLLAEGDRVAARITLMGTHSGDWVGQAPTGRQFRVGAIRIHRLAGGKIAEMWSVTDQLGMQQQMGFAPAPDQ